MKVRFPIIILLLIIHFTGNCQIIINEVLSSNIATNFDTDFGAYSDWIELYNSGNETVDLSGFSISDDSSDFKKWVFPEDVSIAANNYLLLWADGKNHLPGDLANRIFTDTTEITIKNYHLNFKISSESDNIFLFNYDGELISSIEIRDNLNDVSFGLNPNNASEYLFFGTPSPGKINSSDGSTTMEKSANVEFSIQAGMYAISQTLQLSSSSGSGIIKYTTNGSIPNSESTIYDAEIPILYTKTIRARVFENGKLPGNVVTNSYIINQNHNLPVISLSTNYNDLWDFEFGIYQRSLKNREILTHMEYFNATGKKEFSTDAGAQLFGSQIFSMSQKPIALYMRGKYDNSFLDHKLFSDKDINAFKSFVLRNGGNDNGVTMFRDGMVSTLVAQAIDIDYQAYQPTVVYLNGKYWGIHNLREKLNSSYLQNNHNVNADYVDVIEDEMILKDGDLNDFERLYKFIADNDLAIPENYKYVSDKLEVNEFMNLMILKIYAGYKEYQVNNKYWRSREQGSKWRWIAFDLEHSFEGQGSDILSGNTLQKALDETDELRAFSTLIFRKLMTNASFKEEFIQRTAIYLNTLFNPERVISIIDSLQNNIETEMPSHILKWESPRNMATWQLHVNVLKNFGLHRRNYMYSHLMEQFTLTDTCLLQVTSTVGGNIMVCTKPEGNNFTSTIFNNIPISIEAVAEVGYRFKNWSNGITLSKLTVIPYSDTILHAVFEPYVGNVIPDTILGVYVLTKENSPYFSKSDIVIPANNLLIIEAGVEIKMSLNSNFIVNGAFQSLGTDQEPVIIDVNKNIDLNKYKQKYWGAICAENTTDTLKLVNTIIKNASTGSDPLKYKAALSAYNSHVVILNSEIYDAVNPVFCKQGKITIRNAKLHSTQTCDLINLNGCENALIDSCDLKGNFAEDTDAIDFDNVKNSTVSNCNIYGFFGSNSDGIDLGEGSENIILTNNKIDNITDKGVSVGQGSNVIASQNVIVNCGQGFGIKDYNSHAFINQNTLYNNTIGVACFEKNLNAGGGSAALVNTIIANSSQQSVFVDHLSSIEIEYSLSNTDTLKGLNNLFTNPGFTAPSNGNFFLNENSVCINSGNPNYSDPDNSIADIGAYYETNPGINYPIIISEINFNSADSLNTKDWIEIVNKGENNINISNWIFKDENLAHEFVIPDNTLIEPQERIVFCQNLEKFTTFITKNITTLGNFSFGLSSAGEKLSLYNSKYELVHTLQYNPKRLPLTSANGFGSTIELKNNQLDNSEIKSWYSSFTSGGTPGKLNSSGSILSNIYINEFMANNEDYLADKFGEYDDWLEIYNANDFDINLAGLCLSNNINKRINPIPFYNSQNSTIPAKGFKLLWLDKDTEQGLLHLDFKLAASGENISLVQPFYDTILIVDTITFGEQDANISYGRFPDGSSTLLKMNPTPRYSNLMNSKKDNMSVDFTGNIYPNPTNDILNIQVNNCSTNIKIELIDLNGKQLLMKSFKPINSIINTKLSLINFEKGIYILNIQGNTNLSKKVIIN